MVEVDVLAKPFDTGIVLASILKGSVFGVEVFVAAHLADPGVGGVEGRLVLEVDAHGVPSLTHFGILIIGHIVVSVDLSHNS